ncbi:MAG: type II toxin-antitoxin system HicA family toxin [Chloroflexota bacterium]
MTRLPVLRAREVSRALEKLGFSFARQKGSHAIYQHQDGRWTTIPVHPSSSILPDLLSDILRQTNVSREEFMAALGKRHLRKRS